MNVRRRQDVSMDVEMCLAVITAPVLQDINFHQTRGLALVIN